jgi:hypothetical protein
MPENFARSATPATALFAMLCLAGVSGLIFFARSAAVQSLPEYSTLSTAPNGAKLLFDGLNDAGFVAVSRQFKSVSLQRPRHSTVFFLGVDPFALLVADRPSFEEVRTAAAAGNQIVIAVINRKTIDPEDLGKQGDEWGIHVRSTEVTVDKDWIALPEYGPQVWRQRFDKGSIILLGHADRLSNKQIATSDASRHLFAELVGGYPSVVFEEAHLGIRESGSIAGLARHYHLQGLAAGLILVASLFVWNRSVAFPPVPSLRETTLFGSGTRAMLTELMSRHLKGRLLATCVAEWNRTRGRAAALVVPEQSSAVSAYAELQDSLHEKTKFKL